MRVFGISLYNCYDYIPWVTAAVACLAFAPRCRLSRRGVTLWTLFIVLACSRMLVFRMIGGTSLHPRCVPEWLVHFLDISFFGTLALSALAVPLYFWRSRVKAYVLPAVAYGLALIGVLNACAAPIVREETVESERIPSSLDGYRIVHISDIHAYCGCRRWHTQKIVDVANGLYADLVCITGDLADGHPRDCAEYLKPLLSLKAKDGVYAVTGNHEFDLNVNPVREWHDFHQTWGLCFLRNSCVFPRPGLALGGVDDETLRLYSRKVEPLGDAPDVAKAFAGATNGEFRVLMQHQPAGAKRNTEKHGVGLQLSGHWHGGFMPVLRQRLARSSGCRLQGCYQVGKGTIFVSAGCGPWGGFPLRYRTPFEIGLVTLRHAPRK